MIQNNLIFNPGKELKGYALLIDSLYHLFVERTALFINKGYLFTIPNFRIEMRNLGELFLNTDESFLVVSIKKGVHDTLTLV